MALDLLMESKLIKPFNIAHRFQVIDAEQINLINFDTKNKLAPQVKQLIKVARGTREFAMLMFLYPTGEATYYVNEIINGQYEQIEDDNLFADVSHFMEQYLNKIQHGHHH